MIHKLNEKPANLYWDILTYSLTPIVIYQPLRNSEQNHFLKKVYSYSIFCPNILKSLTLCFSNGSSQTSDLQFQKTCISKQSTVSCFILKYSSPVSPLPPLLSCNLLFFSKKMPLSFCLSSCKPIGIYNIYAWNAVQSTYNSWRACNIHERISITHSFTLSIKYWDVFVLSMYQVCYTKSHITTLTKEHGRQHESWPQRTT